VLLSSNSPLLAALQLLAGRVHSINHLTGVEYDMNLLVLYHDAFYVKKKLEEKFPDLTIHAATEEDQVGDFIEGADILMAIRISNDLMKKAKKLQWIQCLITGVDYLLSLPSFPKGVLLTSTRGIHGPQMSEMAFLHMLNLTRNYPRMLRNQDLGTWERWAQPLLYKKAVGILGVGVIGKEIARKAKAFDMDVYGIVSTKRDIEHVDHCYGPEGLMEVLRKVDYFINNIPATPETINLIGAKELSAMKPTAYFINLGRGETVDEEALAGALENKIIAGAALDVFHTEPLPENHPLWQLDNVIITPHVGGMSDIYTDQALPIIEENLRRYLEGERKNLVNVVDY
jgi:phosphoglycerate dehydrogenase-like enzyme